MNTELWGYPILDYVLSLAIVAGVFVTLTALSMLFKNLVSKAVRERSFAAPIEKSFGRISKFVIFIVALYVGVQRFDLSERGLKTAEFIFYTIILFQALVIANVWVKYAWYQSPLVRNPKSHLRTLAGSLAGASILVLWLGAYLALLDNVGFNVATILTGLGVGGIAVGLALQSVVGDMIASFVIGMDLPFEVGDFIWLDENYTGTVEQVGLKTTRLRSINGELLIIPNSNIVSSRIKNYKKMTNRRVLFKIGITYDTPQEMVEKIPGLIKEIITQQKGTRFDRSHFSKFADSSLEFETVYFIESPDYNTFMDTQQAVNNEIRIRFMKSGIEFAFPTQTLQFDSDFEEKLSILKDQNKFKDSHTNR